jgi:hypothetical protein
MLVCGCGSRDEGLHRVSGRVTLGGTALPAGMIYFEPDSFRGNRGPTGYATITGGVYDTRASGRGMIGGPHVVRIDGYDPPPPNAEDGGRTLVRDYRTTLDLPKSEAFQDFDVPAAQGAHR